MLAGWKDELSVGLSVGGRDAKLDVQGVATRVGKWERTMVASWGWGWGHL